MDWATDKVGDRKKAVYLSDLAATLDTSDGKNHSIRPIGPAKRVARHWFRVRKEDGTISKPFPKLCLGYNHETGEVDKECPYCDLGSDFSVEVLQNVIDRDAQETGPRKKNTKPTKSERKKQDLLGQEWRLIDGKDSTSWTPVKLHVFTGAAGRKLGDIVELNRKKTKKGTKVFGPEHPKYGFDIAVKYNKDRQGAEKYGVLKGEESELSEEELEYLLWPLDLEKPEKLKAAAKEAESLADRMVSRDEAEGKGDKKGGKKSKSKKISDDEDEDEDEDNSWGDDDEDDAPKKKKKGGKSRDDDDDDDDDDDRPAKKKKSKKSDDDDEDEDEDDDEPKKKKGKKSKKSSDDDEDEDEDEDDEDEDDEPKKKKKKKSDDWDDDDDEDDSSVKKKSKKSKKSDDDEDDDEDEDDEPKSKKSKKSKSSKKSKKSDDDEDEDEDDDWDEDDDDDDD